MAYTEALGSTLRRPPSHHSTPKLPHMGSRTVPEPITSIPPHQPESPAQRCDPAEGRATESAPSRAGFAQVRFLIGDRLSSVLLLAAVSILAALSEAGILAITAQVATSLVSGASHYHGRFGAVSIDVTLGTLLWLALGLAFVRLALYVASSYLPALISGEVQTTMRRDLLLAFHSASWEVQSQDLEGQFQEVMTNQITIASQGAVQATGLVTFTFTCVVLAISAFALNAVAAVTVLVAASVLFALLRPLNSLGQVRARAFSQVQVEYAGAVGEANRVAEDTKVFGVSEAHGQKIDRLISRSRELFTQMTFLARLGPNVYFSMIYIVLVAGLLVINAANITRFSSLGAVVLILVRAGSYGQQVQSAYVYVRQALPYVDRVRAATERYRSSEEASGNLPLGRVRTLSFMNVGYSYRPERPVLAGISFEVRGGETIGIIGPSGAGKSTMVQILLRLRTPQKGDYRVNGLPASQLSREEWTRRVAYVPQQPRLMHASVADNVRFFRPISDGAVERACRLARIHDEIISWPSGYETIVGQRANAVSGGQQQRICLARALAADPSLLVLDEPTSAVDPSSEALIQESLVALKAKLTLFIIAHRMSTLSIVDRVMIVIDGRLDAMGTVDELLRTNRYYRFASSLSAGPGDWREQTEALDDR